jgi:hypothetical protein
MRKPVDERTEEELAKLNPSQRYYFRNREEKRKYAVDYYYQKRQEILNRMRETRLAKLAELEKT